MGDLRSIQAGDLERYGDVLADCPTAPAPGPSPVPCAHGSPNLCVLSLNHPARTAGELWEAVSRNASGRAVKWTACSTLRQVRAPFSSLRSVCRRRLTTSHRSRVQGVKVRTWRECKALLDEQAGEEMTRGAALLSAQISHSVVPGPRGAWVKQARLMRCWASCGARWTRVIPA